MTNSEEVKAFRDLHPDMSWEKIGNHFGISESTARYHVKKVEDQPDRSTEERSNQGVVTGSFPMITSLDQLLEEMEVDLDEWRVDKHVVNFWGDGERPKTQVKAWLSKLEPEPLRPIVRPLEAVGFKPAEPAAMMGGTETALVILDPHFGFARDRAGNLDPFHDRQVLLAALEVANIVRPARAVWAGDVLDAPEWTKKFARSPEYYFTTMPALIEAHLWLRWFAELVPLSQVVEGNHDRRIENMTVDSLIAAAGLSPADDVEGPDLLSVERLLGLRSLGIEYVGGYPDAEIWLNEEIRIEHGARALASAGKTASRMVQEIPKSTVFGHIHRYESAIRTIHTRDRSRVLEAVCPGAACRIDGVVPGHTGKQQWSQGFALVHYDTTGQGGYQIEQIPVRNGEAWWRGGVVDANETLDRDVDAEIDEYLHERLNAR